MTEPHVNTGAVVSATMTPSYAYRPPSIADIDHCCMLRGGTTSDALWRNGYPSTPNSVNRTVTSPSVGFITPRFVRTSALLATWSTAENRASATSKARTNWP